MSDLSLPPVADHDRAVGCLLSMHGHAPAISVFERALSRQKSRVLSRDKYVVPVRVALVLLDAPSAEQCWEDLTNQVISTPNLSLAVIQVQHISQTAGYLADLVSKPEAADEIRVRLMEAAIAKHAS